jgi:hypothetical protein
MSSDKTVTALGELAKSEYTTATALDAALVDAEDSKLRKNYRKWRDSHVKQGEALNKRIKELGGPTTHYDIRERTLYPVLWTLLRGNHDLRSLTGIRLVAGRGIKSYVDHIDDINDEKTLDLLRRNLESKQDEMKWYDDQVVVERNLELKAELDKSRKVAATLQQEVKDGKAPRRGYAPPLAALLLAAVAAALAFFITQRNQTADEDPFADEYSFEYKDSAASAPPTEDQASV